MKSVPISGESSLAMEMLNLCGMDKLNYCIIDKLNSCGMEKFNHVEWKS